MTRHYDQKQKLDMLAKFERRREDGCSVAEAAAEFNISPSTYHSWVRESTQSNHSGGWKEENIRGAIKILVEPSSQPADSLRDALIRLIVWKRWPTGEADLEFAFAISLISYFNQRYDAAYLSDLPSEALRHIERVTVIGALAEALLWTKSYPPFFDYISIGAPDFDDRDILALIVWVFIAPADGEKRATPSLNKIHQLFEANAFEAQRKKWPMAKNTFNKIWLAAAPAAAFHFVDLFSNAETDELPLPTEKNFASVVDRIVANPSGLRTYIARCKWITEQLEQRLHPVARRSIAFPAFPPTLSSEPFDIRPLPSKVKLNL